MNPTEPATCHPLTCVVVEDQQMFLQLLIGFLQGIQGLKIVATATTTAAGIAACREHQPDLLILDLSLPDHSGIHVAEALQGLQPTARVIVLSAQASGFICPASMRPMLHAVVDKTKVYEILGDEIAELLPNESEEPAAPAYRSLD